MYAMKISVGLGNRFVSINAYHVHIWNPKTGERIFDRNGDSSNWLDEKHWKIMKLLSMLEHELETVKD